MSTILKFPKRRPSLSALLAWLWRLLRLPLFLLLYWIRLPIVALCNLVSRPALLAFICGFFLIPAASPHRYIVWVFGGVSLFAFSLGWLYDSLLLALAPEGVVIGL